jgi:hypothetical protein
MATGKDKTVPTRIPDQQRKPQTPGTGTFDHKEHRKQERGNVIMPRDTFTPDPPPKKGGK